MKYIIYGAGKRGREELEVVGRENVLAFVDRDSAKWGTEYCGIPIIGIDDIRSVEEPAVCVLTPMIGKQEIIDSFQSHEVENYVPLKPFDRMLHYEKEGLLQAILKNCDGETVGIYGISAGSMQLYEYMSANTSKRVVLIPDMCDKRTYGFLKSEYPLTDLQTAYRTIDVLVNAEPGTEEEIGQSLPEGITQLCMQEIFEDAMPYDAQGIKAYKNIHSGQRCFIIATGPSLKTEDLEELYRRGEKCISMNRIYNIFGRTKWRPDYYMIEDTKMIEDLHREIAELDVPVKFVSSVPKTYWEQENTGDALKYQLVMLDTGEEPPLFSPNAERCIYEGTTVTYACIQMAAYMGFEEIYLLGVDFNYSQNLYDDKNHFEGYQSDKTVRLNKVYPKQMEAAYRSARQYAERHGIKIRNATRGGCLEVFERVDFDSLF